MSIAVLTEVYNEMRRLAIAGSSVAPGDFRLKKLLPALEQAGAKAPVFARVAEAVKAVVDSSEATSAPALLDLTVLVNAILYTQGEVGAAGPLEPIETTELGASATQTSARVLKPLLEALTTTGSGRLEIIRDAHERGAFRDLRLVRPALVALDDTYAEIADFAADRILPLYGKAIAPELRMTLDLKGKAGHPRRLRLLHALDPAGTRELVKQALETGSKEMKVVAIECLGSYPEDLSYLLEQAAAKNQEVRQAAYQALANSEDDAAVAVLQQALKGKDLELAADALARSRNARLLGHLIDAAEGELASLGKVKEKKEASQKIGRAIVYLNCLAGRTDARSEAFLLNVFERRSDLAKVKGDTAAGADLISALVRILERGITKQQTALANAHESLPEDDLAPCFHAARRALPADKVFTMFSPYLKTRASEKKKRDPAGARHEAMLDALGASSRHGYWHHQDDREPALDPRWLDVAVQLENLRLVGQLIRPGHAGANAFLSATFQQVLKKAKNAHECHEVISGLVRAAHPEATDAYVAILEKFGKKADYYSFGYWLGSLVIDLPKSALPRLEALIPQLNDRVADSLLGYLQQLREKKEG
jgi:hypothetical protein